MRHQVETMFLLWPPVICAAVGPGRRIVPRRQVPFPGKRTDKPVLISLWLGCACFPGTGPCANRHSGTLRCNGGATTPLFRLNLVASIGAPHRCTSRYRVYNSPGFPGFVRRTTPLSPDRSLPSSPSARSQRATAFSFRRCEMRAVGTSDASVSYRKVSRSSK